MELNDRMYYACSKCSTKSKVQWHMPGTKRWHEHKEFIDLDETNSHRPQYFWCTRHNRSHDFKRDCLQYRAIITYNGKSGNRKSSDSQILHDDILIDINNYILKNSKSLNWKTIIRRNSLPWPCTRLSRLILPDLIYCKADKNMKFKCSITNIIEFETATSAENIANKVQRFNISSKRMIEDGAQSETALPRIIFLYDTRTNISLDYVRDTINIMQYKYLDSVIVDYYSENGEWFKHFLNP